MMKKNIVAAIVCTVFILACGCGQQEDSYAIYQRFLDGEEPVYFREAECFESYEQNIPVEAETPYGFEDICSIISLLTDGKVSPDELDDNISYAYIDCGADGNVELAVKFHNLDYYVIKLEVTLIIKNVDNRLEVCYVMQPYYKETWELANSYGVVNYHVNAGTGLTGDRMGYIDSDGDYYIVWNVYNDFNLYYVYDLSEYFSYEIPEEYIVLRTYTFGSPAQEYRMLAFLDFAMSDYHYNTENSTIDFDGLSKAAAEATGMEFYSHEEIQAMIAAREEELGLTEEIKNGPEVEWHPFTESREL